LEVSGPHAADGNWIQMTPAKAGSPYCGPTAQLLPFFDKTWRPGEIQEVT
jgi:hypothetical protein